MRIATGRAKSRLEQIEKALGINQQDSGGPDPLEMLSAQQRETLKPYLEARKRGDADRRWPEDVQRAILPYLWACTQRNRTTRKVGAGTLSKAEMLRSAWQKKED